MPKVSVIIPIYGVEKYIERCARSLFEQTLDEIEYLFIDDCTPDRSMEILKHVLEEYPQRKPQVNIHRMEQNSGLAKVREWGMRNGNVTGEYIIHCDSDDWVDTDMYRAMYEKAKEDDVDVVVCDYRLTNGEEILKEVKGCRSDDCHRFLMRLLLQRDPWSLCNKLFSRTAYYKELQYAKGDLGEDMLLCIQLMLRCRKISYVNMPYYNYYCNEKSISRFRPSASLQFRNYECLKKNTDLLIEIIKETDLNDKQWIINAFQYNATRPLLNLLHADDKYRKIWMQTYSGANWKYLLNPYVNIDSRIKCLMAITGIYPFKKDRILYFL